MIRLTTLMAAMASAGIASAADGHTSFGVGLDYSTGNYGSDLTTQILSVPVSARYTRGNWNFHASVPWLRVTGDPNVLPTLGLVEHLNPLAGPPAASGPVEKRTASGLGDLTLGATYTVPTGGKLGLDLGVTAKIATADKDKGLGTGANDYGATVDLYRDFNGTTVFGGVGHTRIGASALIAVDSVNSGKVGLSQLVGRGRVGAMYQQRSATTSELDARHDVIGFFNFPTASKGQVQVYASHGLSDSSPAWGVGVAFSSGN